MDASDRLTHYFPWAHSGPPSRQLLLVLDRASRSGEFAAALLLVSQLRQRRRAVVLCASHSPAHYEAIIRKNVSEKLVCIFLFLAHSLFIFITYYHSLFSLNFIFYTGPGP